MYESGRESELEIERGVSTPSRPSLGALARLEPAPRLPQRARRASRQAFPANARERVPPVLSLSLRERGSREEREDRRETPGDRATRRSRAVSLAASASEARAPGSRPVGSAREPVVTYRAPRDRFPHPPALSRGAGRGPVKRGGLAEGRREARETRVRTKTRRTGRRRRRRRRRPRRARWFFKDFRPGSRPSGERRSALTLSYFLCRSPRKRGGGPRVLGRAARLT